MTQYVIRVAPSSLGAAGGGTAPGLSYRLALPRPAAAVPPPRGSVIWVLVRYGDADYLHARLEVLRHVARGRAAGTIMAALHGSTYYTATPRLRVPACAIRTLRPQGGPTALDVARPTLLAELEATARRCVPRLATAGALGRAVAPLARVIASATPRPFIFRQAWDELKRRVPACDLYRWRGLDPYEAAAHALADRTEAPMPERSKARRRPAGGPTHPLVTLTEGDVRTPASDLGTRWCRRGDLDRATARHQETLRSLCRAVVAAGLRTAASRLVDLVGRGEQRDVIFEVKTVGDLTWCDQARAALGQLLHYSFHYRACLREPILVAVFDQEPLNPAAGRARRFLEHYGVRVVWDAEECFPGLSRVAASTRRVSGS